jgi:hypothetical protein
LQGAFVCLSNNPLLVPLVAPLKFLAAEASAVLVEARSLVQSRWRLLTHPLYGNFRPRDVLFRSILLEAPGEETTDPDSVLLVESALERYRADPSVPGRAFPERWRHDAAEVDLALLRESLSRYGLLRRPGVPSGPMPLGKGGEVECCR